MTRRLNGFVLAADPDGQRILLNPSDPLPEWAHQTITNPKAWVGDPDDTPDIPAAAQEDANPAAPGPAGGEDPAPADVQQDDDQEPPAPPAEDSDQLRGDTPNEQWTNKEIKAYAATHGVNLGQATTKAELLAKVRA